ncbi:MAG TPA: carbon-nitrogen hydrolase family protein [Verrucomicrobiota bacterium]|nr:carbon-nitrogen hydrolase family protein [Verrucomicrobiales bacterium]HRI16016.1 carbon-nitrogen hydrolase family protein [Verrucomicrobiota bacterium]
MLALALIQMRVDGGEPEANLERAAARIATASAQGAEVVVLPEALDLGWTHPSAATSAQPIPDGRTARRLRDTARLNHVWVCSGLVERDGSSVFNSSILIDPTGEVVLHHRKLNELEIGQSCYAGGDRLAVATTPWGVVGMMICSDAFAPGQVIARTLGLLGAQIILSPCAWAVPADHDPVGEPYGQLWQDNYGPVARDFRLWIAGVSNVGPLTAGPWAGRRCIGCSLLVGPDGLPVLRGPYGGDADVILRANVELEPRPARGDGWVRWREDQFRREMPRVGKA